MKRTRDTRTRATLGALSAAAAVLLAGAGAAAQVPCDQFAPSASHYAGGDPRVREIDVEGMRVVVLVPPGYDDSDDKYPVVYLMPGGGHTPDATYLINTDLIAFTADPARPPVIVVMPDPWEIGALWIDWRSGAFLEETFFTDTLVPAVDARFRTRPGRANRAVAGFSAGGFGALHLAARHPDLFAAVAGFDAVADLDERDPYYQGLWTAISAGRPLCEGHDPAAPFGMLGDPATDRIWWANASPASLAPNFIGTSLSVFVGNRKPCDPQDVADYASYWFGTQSLFVYPSNERFHAALQASNVAHAYAARCGMHSYRHLQRQIHDWWAPMFASFGSPSPAVFDYRRADATFTVWGWTFTTDTARAPEFLDATDASCEGITLSGSGLTSVTTAPCFGPREEVALDGAVETSAVADDAGRITFTVDLGPAHEHQQYSPIARVLEAAGGYWRTQAVVFSSV